MTQTDARSRRFQAPLPAAAILTIILCGSWQPASASTLTIQDICVEHLDIRPGAMETVLPGALNVVRSANGDETISTEPESCGTSRDGGTIHVPVGTAIVINNVLHDTSFDIQEINGPLTVTGGRGAIDVDQTTDLVLSTIGDESVRIGKVSGTLKAESTAGGDLTIDTANVTKATLTNLSNGDMLINGGTIGSLTAQGAGSGDIRINAAVTEGTVMLLGSGDILLKSVSGKLHKVLVGSGDLVIGNARPAPSAKAPPPSSHSGHFLIPLLTLLLCVIAVRTMKKRADSTGQSWITLPRRMWDDAADGYASFVRNWEQRMAEQRTRPQSSSTPPHIYYTRRAVDLWEEVTQTAHQQRQMHRDRAATPPLQDGHPLARLNEHLARLEPRLARMEHFVTSTDFMLERQFRDLERL